MDSLNKRTKTLNLKDIALIELGGVSLGIMLAALAELLTEIGFHWYLLAYLLFAIKPIGKMRPPAAKALVEQSCSFGNQK